MKIRNGIWILGFVTFMVLGCDGSPIIIDDPCLGGCHVEQTSPENVIAILEESYLRREIEVYARLLAPEFIFKVQEVDVAEFGETFSRDRDSTGTAALFNSPLVSDIRIILTHGAATVPTEIEFAPGTMKIRIQPTFLEVDEATGITWQVDGDIQDLFFRPGDADAGENPDHWVIIEWRDIPGGATSPGESGAGVPQNVLGTTWGAIKSQYTS